MQARVAYAAVGLFVLVLGAALLGSALWLGSGRERGEFRHYYAYSDESVAALGPSSRVTYRGVDVGSVAAIELDPQDPTRVRLTLAIGADAPVRTDTVATIAMQGLTGLGSVELTGGSRQAPLLHETKASEYPVIAMEPSLFNRLDTAARSAMTTLDQVSQRLLVILDDDNTRAVAGVLADARRISETLAGQGERIERTLADLEHIAAAGAQAATALPALTGDAQRVLGEADGLIAALRTSTEQVTAAAGQSSAQIEYTGGVLLPEIERLVVDLRQAAGTLGALGEDLSSNPQMLLIGPPKVQPGPGE